MLGGDDVGHRVVVRRIVGIRANRPIFSDALGELTAASETHLTVRTADGEVRIARSDITAAKRVPDRRARSATERLELVTAQGWPAPDTARLGDWLLRSADGWSGRGNSALAVGDPGRPIAEAVDAAVAWYRDRRRPPLIAVPLPLGRRLMPELDRRGWGTLPTTLVQTADLAPLAALVGADPAVTIAGAASEAWLTHVGGRKGGLPAAARHILTALPGAGFAHGYDGSGALVATARGVVVDGWLGLSVLGVDPQHQRRGWGRRLTAALATWALDRGASRGYLQVEERNVAAVALYAGLGFRTAHGYVVRHLPAG